MEQSENDTYIPLAPVSSGKGREPRPGIYNYINQMVNLAMMGVPGAGNQVLIDAGL